MIKEPSVRYSQGLLYVIFNSHVPTYTSTSIIITIWNNLILQNIKFVFNRIKSLNRNKKWKVGTSRFGLRVPGMETITCEDDPLTANEKKRQSLSFECPVWSHEVEGVSAHLDIRASQSRAAPLNQSASDFWIWYRFCYWEFSYEQRLYPYQKETKGVDLQGTVHPHLITVVFRQQSEPWEELSTTHLSDVKDIVEQYVKATFRKVVQEPSVLQNLEWFLRPRILEGHSKADEELRKLLEDERGGILQTVNHYLAENLAKIRSDREIRRLKKAWLRGR